MHVVLVFPITSIRTTVQILTMLSLWRVENEKQAVTGKLDLSQTSKPKKHVHTESYKYDQTHFPCYKFWLYSLDMIMII